MKSPFIFLFLLLLLAVSQCTDPSGALPSSFGRIGELLVVAPDSVLNASVRNYFTDKISGEYPGLPQHESNLKLTIASPGDMLGILRIHRNILFIEQQKDLGKKFSLTVERNKTARPQLVFRLAVKPEIPLSEAADSLAPALLEYVNKEERARQIHILEKSFNRPLYDSLLNRTGIGMKTPEDFFSAVLKNDFAWLRKETAHTSSGILLYTIHREGGSLNPGEMIRLRDSVTRNNIPGPSPGSYMITDKNFPLVSNRDQINDCEAIVIRGLWRTEGDFMGGPFIAAAIDDPKNNRVIILDGFVYAPKFDKRNYIRQLEAILFTASF